MSYSIVTCDNSLMVSIIADLYSFFAFIYLYYGYNVAICVSVFKS